MESHGETIEMKFLIDLNFEWVLFFDSAGDYPGLITTDLNLEHILTIKNTYIVNQNWADTDELQISMFSTFAKDLVRPRPASVSVRYEVILTVHRPNPNPFKTTS